MQAQAISETAKPLMIVVPRAQTTLYESLHRAFDQDGTVEVTLDRRSTETPESAQRHHPERRRRPEVHSELTAGRWVVVTRASRAADRLDAATRAILFLCCSHHVVPCQHCQNTYRLGWIQRLEPSGFACPLCQNDLTQTVLAHIHGCRNFADDALKAG
jgi:hypothetical protein